MNLMRWMEKRHVKGCVGCLHDRALPGRDVRLDNFDIFK
jgi:hypothetical protein